MNPPVAGSTSRARAVAPLGGVVAAACLGWHAARYLPFFADDGFVSLRYAARLLAGAGLTFNDGEWVEGYSNLLWVLAVAALGTLGIDLIVAARALGLVGMGIAVFLVATARRPPDEALSGAPAALALALAGPVAVWAMGGLEQGLLAGLLAGAVVATWPLLDGEPTPSRALTAGALYALLCWTRPDGPLFGGVAALIVVAVRRDRRGLGIAAALLALPALAVLGQLAFRLATYGAWLPNTALVKLDPSAFRLQRGAAYLARGVAATWPLGLAALLALRAGQEADRRRRLTLAAGLALAWGGYVCLIGGDIFAAHRHLVPILVLEGLIAAEGLRWLASRRPRLALALGIGLVLGAFVAQSRDRASRVATADNIAWNGYALGLFLREAFGAADPLIAVGAVGALPYASGARVVDLFGLTDRHVARTGVHQARLAHPTVGDPAYVIERRPDILQFHSIRGSSKLVGPMGAALRSDPRTARRYRPVKFQVNRKLQSILWVRVESDKVGIRRGQRRVEVPGHLLGVASRSTTVLAEGGVTAARCGPRRSARSAAFLLPAGRWTVRAEARGGPAAVAFAGRAAPRLDGDGAFFHRGGPIRMVVSCAKRGTLVERVGFRLAEGG